MADTEPVIIRPPAEDTDRRINWFGTFRCPTWEQQYRVYELPEGIKLVRVFVGIVLALFFAFLVNDYRFFGPSPMLAVMVALRGVIIAMSIAVFFIVRPGMAPARFDLFIIVWTMLAKIVVLYMVTTRPAGFTAYSIVTVLSIVLTYWIVPVPFIWRTLTALFMTAGLLIIGFWINPWPDASTAITVTLALVMANVIGGEMAREQQVWRRRQFLALCEQHELRASLERAMGEIKTLRGIVPICMHCKRISNDLGDWEQIETYVRQHSHVEFSHGLCPECARSQYPEIDWEDARRQREQRLKNTPTPTPPKR